MSLTGNYEAAFELSEQTVREIFLSSHENGEIPHEVRADRTIGGLAVHAVANVLQTNVAGDLGLSFSTPVHNGIEMRLPLDVEVQVENSPAPSINPIEFSCYLKVVAPVEAVASPTDGNDELVMNLHGLPAGQVTVVMPPAPVVSVNEALIEDGLHKAYDDGVIPHEYSGYAGIQVDILDDDEDAGKQIHFTIQQTVTESQEGHGTITLPLLIHLYGGMDSLATIRNVRLALAGDELQVRFGGITNADVTLSVGTAEAVGLIANMVRGFGTRKVFVPRNSTLADLIAVEVRAKLDTWGADHNGRIHLYTPNAVENLPVEIRTFVPVVKPGFLAVLFNPMANPDPNSVENFIPPGKKFAQALAEPVMQEMFREAVRVNILEANHDTNFPCTYEKKIEGHTVTLTEEPSFALHNGYIQMNGSAEVAIDCWFDPDVDYEAKVGLSFGTDENGNKIIQPNVYDADAGLSCLDWFLGVIILIYGWIAIGIAHSVVESVGGTVVSEEGNDIASGTKYLAGEIHGVGHVTTELDQITIEPRGVILSGGTFLMQTQQALMYVPSESSSPYKCSAGQSLTIKAQHTASGASHLWKIGSVERTAREFVLPFPRSGWYPVALETEMKGPKSADTHHFGRVRVDSVKPVVNAGPDCTVKEGEVVEFTGTFSNAEYEDRHKARWSWGDDSMAIGTVSEVLAPPKAQGTVRGTHAYGNNGDYTVTLRVIDEDGSVGIDTKKVRVLNVPPAVQMPAYFIAYPGIPVTLTASFTDPGWLDTHRAFWVFGDGTVAMPATVKEVNLAPIGYGIAAASNIYTTLGAFYARCVVIDSDGGAGGGAMPVYVTELKNRDFEGGFRALLQGEVANFWKPYGNGTLAAELFKVHDGQRSQRMTANSGARVGLHQFLATNVGWDYQLSAWYHIDEKTEGGRCRLGVDPAGGIDPSAATVCWFEGNEQNEWNRLMVRVTAAAPKLTVFLETVTERGSVSAVFDGVEFIPYPAPLPAPVAPALPTPETPEKKKCVNWADVKESRELGSSFVREGFAFNSLQSASLRVALWGSARTGHLVVPMSGVKAVLPFAANRVGVQIRHYKIETVEVCAYNAGGDCVGRAVSQKEGSDTVILRAPEIAYVVLVSEGGEALLEQLCAFAGDEAAAGGLTRIPDRVELAPLDATRKIALPDGLMAGVDFGFLMERHS
jgi:hypothetical protein